VTEEGKKLRWKVMMTVKGGFETGMGPSTPTIATDSPWFCYVTPAPVVWLYDGGQRLFTIEVVEQTVKGQAIPVLTPTVVTLPQDWSLLLKKNPPREVLDRLPAGVRPKGSAVASNPSMASHALTPPTLPQPHPATPRPAASRRTAPCRTPRA
jgi:hypothetical protein